MVLKKQKKVKKQSGIYHLLMKIWKVLFASHRNIFPIFDNIWVLIRAPGPRGHDATASVTNIWIISHFFYISYRRPSGSGSVRVLNRPQLSVVGGEV